jgi:hypothetical protein
MLSSPPRRVWRVMGVLFVLTTKLMPADTSSAVSRKRQSYETRKLQRILVWRMLLHSVLRQPWLSRISPSCS